jgi:hypothetical protein
MDQQSKTSNPLNQATAAQQREDELADAILHYLSEYPHAMDTLEGIAEWWLMREQVRVEVDALVRVLQHMVERDLLDEIGSGENVRYQLKPQAELKE